MFRLIRGLIGLVISAALVYVAVYVPLGEKTLWQHIRAIAGSSASRELVREVKDKADRVLDKSKGERSTGAKRPPAKAAKDDGFTPAERRKLRELIKDKLDKAEAERR